MSSRDLQLAFIENAERPISDPLLLVLWEHSGTAERMSTLEAVSFDGENYLDSGLDIPALTPGEKATIVVPATSARVGEVEQRAYSHRTCKIYSIEGASDDEDDFDLIDSVLVLDGIIESSEFDEGAGTVRASIVSKYARGNLTPRFTVDEVANHIPASGTVLFSAKENLELERSR